MSMYDAIIIGAGPCGTAAGYDLAAAGYSVLILDRRAFPRKKACAGGITPKAMNLFAYDISSLIHRTCYRVKVTRPGGTPFMVRAKTPLCYMVQRMDLDHFALNKALEKGAEFKPVDRLLSISDEKGRHSKKACVSLWVLENGVEKQLKARFLIGADGANSAVRRLLGKEKLSGLPARVCKYPALEADVRVTSPWNYPMEFDFSKDVPGYFWVFPKQDGVNIGIFSTRPHASINRDQLKAYACERFGATSLSAVKGYPIGVGGLGRMGKPGSGRVLLAGDAAGLAEPLLGEGIYSALKSGRLAARAISGALETGNSQALAMYRHSLARMGLGLGFFHMAAWILYRFPSPCLFLAGHSSVHNYFAHGYARGKSFSRLIFPF